jgi:TolA-binding protein
MQSAELCQRQRIAQFCEQYRISVPNFASTSDLLFCIQSALHILDGESDSSSSLSSKSQRIAELNDRIQELESELDEQIIEANELEVKLKKAQELESRVEALELISRIESRSIQASNITHQQKKTKLLK